MIERRKAQMVEPVFSQLGARTMGGEFRTEERISPWQAAREIIGIVASVVDVSGDPEKVFGECYAPLVRGINSVIEDYQESPFVAPESMEARE